MRYKTFVLLNILILCSVQLYGQTKYNRINDTRFCDNLIEIEKTDFLENWTRANKIDSLTGIEKVDEIITIQARDTIFKFVDIVNDDYVFIYSVVGNLSQKNWILILAQDFHQDYYYLINTDNGRIDTLVGNPSIYGDRMLCIEAPYTDWPGFVEIWTIIGDNITLTNKYRMSTCRLYSINEIYLYNEYLFLSTHDKYLKLKID